MCLYGSACNDTFAAAVAVANSIYAGRCNHGDSRTLFPGSTASDDYALTHKGRWQPGKRGCSLASYSLPIWMSLLKQAMALPFLIEYAQVAVYHLYIG